MKSLLLFQLLGLCVAIQCGRMMREHKINGRKVVVFTNKVNWFKASETCRKRGMQLLTIKSPRDNFEVTELGQNYNLEWVWTAATDLADRRIWVWSTDGSVVRDRFWRNGEPSSRTEHCVEAHMHGFPSNWNDNDCKRLRPFMCEEVLDEVIGQDSEEYEEEDDDYYDNK